MDTAVIRISGALLCLGLSWRVLTDWDPKPFGDRSQQVAVSALMKQAEKFNDEQQYAKAVKATEALYLTDPANYIYAGLLATAKQGLHEYQAAAGLWEEYLRNAPVPGEACPQIGLAYRDAGQTAKALDALQRCLAFEPKNPDILYALGATYMETDSRAEAESAFRKGLSLAADDADLSLGLGRLALRRGKAGEAAGVAAAVLKRQSENSDALLLAGMAATDQGRLADARRFLEHAARVTSRDTDIRAALARVQAREGREGKAK